MTNQNTPELAMRTDDPIAAWSDQARAACERLIGALIAEASGGACDALTLEIAGLAYQLGGHDGLAQLRRGWAAASVDAVLAPRAIDRDAPACYVAGYVAAEAVQWLPAERCQVCREPPERCAGADTGRCEVGAADE